MKKLLFILLFSLPMLKASGAKNDTLLFKNGNIIIGEVKKIQLGVITFKPNDINEITVQVRKLSSIHASGRDFRIETLDRQVLIGELHHNTQSGFVNVVLGTDTTAVLLVNIFDMYPVERNVLSRINGFASAGFSYTKSSDLGRLNFDGNLKYLNRKTEVTVTYSSISTIEAGSFSKDNENAAVRYNYLFHARWFAGSILSYQRNIELGIRSRLQEGIGIGNKLIAAKHVQLVLFTGTVFNQETSTEDVYSGRIPEFTAGMRFNIFRFEIPKINCETLQNFYSGFTQERYRYDGSISLRWEMIKDLFLDISYYTNYDSKPPGEESENLDYGTVLGVSYKF